MGLLDRFFSKRRAEREATASDLARSQVLSGQAISQSDDEQVATRGRIEAELDAQRARREPPASPVA